MKRLNFFVFFSLVVAMMSVESLATTVTDDHLQSPSATEKQADRDFVIQVDARAGRLRVQVVNKQSGQFIANARVLVRHWTMANRKNASPSSPGFIVLEPDGNGGYVCPHEHIGHGEQIFVRAQIPGMDREVKTSLVIDN